MALLALACPAHVSFHSEKNGERMEHEQGYGRKRGGIRMGIRVALVTLLAGCRDTSSPNTAVVADTSTVPVCITKPAEPKRRSYVSPWDWGGEHTRNIPNPFDYAFFREEEGDTGDIHGHDEHITNTMQALDITSLRIYADDRSGGEVRIFFALRKEAGEPTVERFAPPLRDAAMQLYERVFRQYRITHESTTLIRNDTEWCLSFGLEQIPTPSPSAPRSEPAASPSAG